MNPVISVNHLHKAYGTTVAVDDISFNVAPGEIFGIVGPNGAGKSTTVESIMGLREPDSGNVSVLGLNPHTQRSAVSQRIGIQLQQAALPDRMKVWEALDLYSSFYTNTIPWEPLLEEWGLGDKRTARFVNLSGGQKQRLFIALALLNDPDVVFLDELTTGLDPQARRSTWDLVADIRDRGKTVVLVTHFMDEAEALCDNVAIIDHGNIIALDTPARLIEQVDDELRVTFEVDGPFSAEILSSLPQVSDISRSGRRWTARGDARNLLSAVVIALEQNAVRVTNLQTERASLEDVFITLTGRQIRA
ncbi:MAG: ABC transporter ATP-binding protein [Anaerolineae bacterium]|nr:ABC transporter ATP-binding protein [Anaerolineae bacterium]MCO5196914.1 ABC transporter ATP-binding protein [Anaerolineae bacterium]